MTTLRVDIEGLDKIVAKLGQVQGAIRERELWQEAGENIVQRTAPYPPTTIANSPLNPSGRWYQRGVGVMTRSGKVYRTSRDLKNKWYVDAMQEAVEVGNRAAYAPFVHGSLRKQAVFHALRGWKPLWKTAVDYLPELVRVFELRIREIWDA